MALKYGLATRSIHGSESNKGKSEPVTVPIYQSSTYIFPNTDAMERCIVHREMNQHEYVRFGNPAQDVLNERLALLAAHEAGIAPMPSYQSSELLVTPFVRGQQATLDDLPRMLLKGLHRHIYQLD